MAENELAPPVLGVSWDGTGYGLDGTLWGGEFFVVTETSCTRVAHLRPFRLVGGTAAIKEPRRTALGLLYATFGEEAFALTRLATLQAFTPVELASLKQMLGRGLNSPLSSSAGRLFDAVASLAGLRQEVRFEGQAAMELEFALEGIQTRKAYPFRFVNPAAVLDWSPMIEAIVADVNAGVSRRQIAARFHNALTEGILAVAKQVGLSRIVLSGGCFQNGYLTEQTVRRLQEENYRPYWHQRIPPNDGGIALGQVVAALRQVTLTQPG